MTSNTNSRIGGHILADQLHVQGVDTVFCVPGESYLALLDGLYEHRQAIRVVTTRHEAGAANMAEAYGKLTGRPGVCAVTRGPGATNAANGLHTAFQDSTPMIVLIGQVSRAAREREAFQEIEYRQMFAPLAKWVGEIGQADRIPEYLSRAFHLATSGRPGPVVLSLPEDMLVEEAAVDDAPAARPTQAAPTPAAIESLGERLRHSRRPLAIIGGATWSQTAVDDMTRFAEANGLPVAAAFRAQDRFDNRHANFVGTVGIAIDPRLRERVGASDLLIVIGDRLGEITTQGYRLIDIPKPAQSLIHVHPGADELGRVFAPDLAINSGIAEFTRAAAALPGIGSERFAEWREAARADYLDYLNPTEMPGELNLGEVIAHLNEVLPDDAILANGAGNATGWLHRFFQYRDFGTQLAPTSGSMGYGVPAAIGAKLIHPDRVVISLTGDGCFLMTGQELATATQYGAAAVFIVVNNSMLATIRMHQERRFPGRVIATDLVNPDFVALAEAYGAHAECVRRTADFPAAFERALNAGRPALLELLVDPRALTPTYVLDAAD